MGRQVRTMWMMRLTLVLLATLLMVVRGRRLSFPDPKLQVAKIMETVSRHSGTIEPKLKEQAKGQSRPVRQVSDPPLRPYRYGYAVLDDVGNDFNQQEQSDGFQVTGQYSVLLPDGRVQTVQYFVTPDTGFVAEVAYEGNGGPVFIESGPAGK